MESKRDPVEAGGHSGRELTDEMIALARTRIGAPIPAHEPFNRWVTEDGIRHFAHGLGDDNPLFCDPDYAARTRWGGVIAPPLFFRSAGVPEPRQWTPEARANARDPLSGIHSWYSGDAIYWLRAMKAGDQLYERRFRKNYIEKPSTFAGRTVLEIVRREYRNQDGELVVVSDQTNIRGGRQKSWGERKKYADYRQQRYTPADIANIDLQYARELRRGAQPRYFEDVAIGDRLQDRVKGPITQTDIMAWNMGWGFAMQYHGAHRLAYQWRAAHPRAYLLNDDGIPDCIEAVHWHDGLARLTGNPFAYDYGGQRISWLAHCVSDWMGDDGWLLKMDARIQRFVYLGDTVWIKGIVSGKEELQGQRSVTVELEVMDQRHELTAGAAATVLLPSRQFGPVAIPPRIQLG